MPFSLQKHALCVGQRNSFAHSILSSMHSRLERDYFLNELLNWFSKKNKTLLLWSELNRRWWTWIEWVKFLEPFPTLNIYISNLKQGFKLAIRTKLRLGISSKIRYIICFCCCIMMRIVGNINLQINICIFQGVEIDPMKRADWTPLMLACTKQDNVIVRLLIEHGASPTLRNKDGWNSFHLACREGNESIVSYLLTVDPTLWQSRSKNGRTPLHTVGLNTHDCKTNKIQVKTNHFFPSI